MNLKKHKLLTPTVIKYLQKMYSYTLKEHQGNETSLSCNIVNHSSQLWQS
jgi:hypothetical protein